MGELHNTEQGDNHVLLEIKGVSKLFPGVKAVDNVSFSIKKGEVHVLIGENGAGKSTLMKMLSGIYSVDEGEFLLNGEKFEPHTVSEAQEKGVNMVHQELNLMGNRTVAQNVYVGREPLTKGAFKRVDYKSINSDCAKVMESLGVDIKPTAQIKDLSIALQQMVEVTKAVSMKNQILIMDEPTSSLTTKEIDKLFEIIRKLKDNGTSIIYISHRMQELLEIGDRITVMRDGKYIGTRDAKNININELISMMVGREINMVFNRHYNVPGEEMLCTKDLAGLRFRNININIHAGEIVGMAGLVGAGRTELAKAIFGYDKIEDGELYVEGKKIPTSHYNTSKAIAYGLSFLPEDRKCEGLFLKMSIKSNIAIVGDKKIGQKAVINNDKNEKKLAQQYQKKLRIATPNVEKDVCELSGGNQQKVVVGKWLATENKVYIFDEPTRGIDVGAKSEIYSIMDELAKSGAAVLMISSDMIELIGMADRIYIMKDGEMTGEFSRINEQFDQEAILEAMLIGGSSNE